jgi:hypothetical protein
MFSLGKRSLFLLAEGRMERACTILWNKVIWKCNASGSQTSKFCSSFCDEVVFVLL